jgi:hypothetical protein
MTREEDIGMSIRIVLAGMAGLLLAMAIPAPAPAFAAGPHLESFVANDEWGWQGQLDVAADGRMTLCTVSTVFDDRSALYFMLDRGHDFSLGLLDPKGRLEPGTREAVTFQIDRNPRFKGEFVAVSPQTRLLDLPESEALYQQIRLGDEMVFETAAGRVGVGLQGTMKALAALWECVDRGLAAEPKGPGGKN